jgi:hypothetical protein
LEGRVHALRHYPCIFLERLGITTKTLVRIASVPVEIRTEHLPNISLEHYRYTNPLGVHIPEDCTLENTKSNNPDSAEDYKL